MGIIVRSVESQERAELEKFCQMLLARAASVHSRKGEGGVEKRRKNKEEEEEEEEKVVCVTSGVSFLGLALVNHLRARGYSVRLILHNQEDREKVETSSGTRGIEAVVANLNEVKSLEEAFDGCHGVFHTSAFVDPAALSGYSKSMAEIEVKASENVMEACARTPSVKKCVLTSSLLACIWRDTSLSDLSPLINHDSWSDESLCIDKKVVTKEAQRIKRVILASQTTSVTIVTAPFFRSIWRNDNVIFGWIIAGLQTLFSKSILWYALGKLRAEKTAWKIAEKRGLKLTTICPGLITGPDFYHRNTTPTIAYLKGAQEMYANGLLATVDVCRLAEAHVSVYEEMKKTASGRYICFDYVIKREEEAEKLAQEIGMKTNRISENASDDSTNAQFELSKWKLSNLMSRTMQRCYNESLQSN